MSHPSPAAARVPEPRPEPAVLRLGMPELALGGLSEGWLLRACGARHWSAVAASFRVAPERLEDSHGNRLYPSFLAVRLSGSSLAAFHEGDEARLDTTMTRLSRNRFLSRHRFSTDGRKGDLTVEMISALLKRDRTRDNTSLREAEAPIRAFAPGGAAVDSDLAAADREIRGRGAQEASAPPAERFRFRYRPALRSDFNGVGLLYFASYHAIADRAECAALGLPAALEWITSARDTFFFANINPGDEVEAVVFDVSESADALRHRARLFRASDGRRMAELFTTKRRAS